MDGILAGSGQVQRKDSSPQISIQVINGQGIEVNRVPPTNSAPMPMPPAPAQSSTTAGRSPRVRSGAQQCQEVAVDVKKWMPSSVASWYSQREMRPNGCQGDTNAWGSHRVPSSIGHVTNISSDLENTSERSPESAGPIRCPWLRNEVSVFSS